MSAANRILRLMQLALRLNDPDLTDADRYSLQRDVARVCREIDDLLGVRA